MKEILIIYFTTKGSSLLFSFNLVILVPYNKYGSSYLHSTVNFHGKKFLPALNCQFPWKKVLDDFHFLCWQLWSRLGESNSSTCKIINMLGTKTLDGKIIIRRRVLHEDCGKAVELDVIQVSIV